MVRDVMRDLYGKRKLDPNYLTGEMDEFHEAYNDKNPAGLDEEMQDVIYALHLLKHQATRKNFPIVGADDKIREFYHRKDFFDQAFKERNVPFSTDYLAEGSNPLKPHKIQRAFALAGHQITPEDAQSISQRYQPMTPQKIAALVMEKVAVSRWREAIYSGELPTQDAENLKKYMGADPNRYADRLSEGVMNRLKERHNTLTETTNLDMNKVRQAMPPWFGNKFDAAKNELARQMASYTDGAGDIHLSHPQVRQMGVLGEMPNKPEYEKQLRSLILSHEGMESDFSRQNTLRRLGKQWERSPLNEPIFSDTEAHRRMSPRDYARMMNRAEEASLKVTTPGAMRHNARATNPYRPTPTKMPSMAKSQIAQTQGTMAGIGALHPSAQSKSIEDMINSSVEATAPDIIHRGAHADPRVVINEYRQSRMMSPEVAQAMAKVRTKLTGETPLLRESSNTPITSENTLLPKREIPEIAKRMRSISDANYPRHLQDYRESTGKLFNKVIPPVRKAVSAGTGLLMKAKGLLHR
jgi:hypothetical protein